MARRPQWIRKGAGVFALVRRGVGQGRAGGTGRGAGWGGTESYYRDALPLPTFRADSLMSLELYLLRHSQRTHLPDQMRSCIPHRLSRGIITSHLRTWRPSRQTCAGHRLLRHCEVEDTSSAQGARGAIKGAPPAAGREEGAGPQGVRPMCAGRTSPREGSRRCARRSVRP